MMSANSKWRALVCVSKINVLLLCVLLVSGRQSVLAENLWQASPLPPGQLQVTVMDQNGQPLALVIVIVQQNDKTIAQERTTASGSVALRKLAPGTYKVLIEKQGFYSAAVPELEIASGQQMPLEVRLQPVREYREEIEVTAQPSPIDPEESSSSQSVTAADISNIPYSSTRDYRNVLPYIPGVIADSGGQIHVVGASTQEVQDYLDGFEVSQPAGGALGLRLNPDSLRKVDVRSSRYSAQFGKGSGGLLDLQVQDGDNRFRMNATDFVPTFQNVKGIQLNNWTPRAYVSGPLVRDKVWFDLSHEGETDYNVVKELPDGADTNRVWRIADLGRLRMNLTPGNVLTASTLLNVQDSRDSGISPFDPISVSTNNHSYLYLIGLKDQITVARDTLMEFGVALHRSQTSSLPQGDLPYVLGVTDRSGNFYMTNRNHSTRTQGFANMFLRPWKLAGTHQFTVGGRADKVVYQGDIQRGPLEFLDANNALLREITFSPTPGFGLRTTESSAFVQDRWIPVQRLLIEPGVRWDHDSFIQRDFFSPRIAATVLADLKSETKISAGVGIYYDRTNLALVSNAVQGIRTNTFFAPVAQTFTDTFTVNPLQLAMPRYTNWSVAIDRRLPGKVYARLEYISRHGQHGWAYEGQPGSGFTLQSDRQDRYDAAQLTVRKELKRGYPMLIAYTRSKTTSNRTVDFSIDAFLEGNQANGALPWDAPNQMTAWGSYPLFWKLKKFDFAWSMIWHTGFPFVTIDQFGKILSGPGQFRLPDFFTADPAIERKFTYRGYRWAARVGIDNVTGRLNPFFVDNNVNSPTFLTFFGSGHRTLNGRIRFLGKQ
jgi:Carboxypeptidase regulatory-like domain/TonB-dependent Receptor Plug Domain